MVLVHLRLVPESVGGGHTVFDCDAKLLIFTGVGGGRGIPAGASVFDCANLELALLSWVLVFIAGGSGSTE